MEPVGVGRRAVAVIIDSILLMIVGYLIATLTGGTSEAGFNLEGAPFFLWSGVALVYYIVMEKTSGATLGKMAMKLKVVKIGGEPLDWQASVVRNVMRLIDGFLFYLVGALAVWFSKNKQRLGDMAASTIVVRVQSWVPILFVAVFGAVIATDAMAGPPRYTQIVLSQEKDGPAKSSFEKDTPKVYLRSKLLDMPAGTKVKGDWIAVKTQVAPPNHKIDSHEMAVSKGMDNLTFSLSKPTAGWPEGDYRVDLFIDGKAAGEVKFKVAK